MSQLLHLRLGRFFGRHALGKPDGIASVLEMTARLDEMAHRACRAIEWRSATEVWLDLGTGRGSRSPWAIADELRAATEALLPVKVACGVAATKTAARAASALAAPSGLLVVLPGYESSIVSMARKQMPWQIDEVVDAAPFRPSLVPRAIVRSATVERRSEAADPKMLPTEMDALIERLVRDACAGLGDLSVIASTVRVQFSNSAGVREEFASLADATALADAIVDVARPLGRRVLASTAGSGHLLVSLGQLIAGPAQASLFGWRYDHAGADTWRRFA